MRRYFTTRLEALSQQLGGSNPIWMLAILGAFCGSIAGLVMVGFRILVEWPLSGVFADHDPENFESLTWYWRWLLPALGGLLLGIWFQRISRTSRQIGVPHVMILLARRDGLLPMKNALVQFFGATISLLCGHSVGREGPSIHVGAACSSWVGQRLQIPHHSVRVLVGCGVAGAIAAAFNTPLAGVIFTMEVLLVEYSLASFIPIILAAVCATAISQGVFGAEPIFVVPGVSLATLTELVYVVIMGILIGLLSSLFIFLIQRVNRMLNQQPEWARLGIAGAITGLIAIPVPEVMGIGYDTVNQALQNNLAIGMLMLILIAKILATTIGIGLGLPGGLIGPTLFIGAMAGGAFGQLFTLSAVTASSAALFAMLGMGAMMSATLNAPLAALIALLELTNNPHIIMPGMLAIVAANLTCQHLLQTPSAFTIGVRAQSRGLGYRALDPIAQILRRRSVLQAMDRSVQTCHQTLEAGELRNLLSNPPNWLLLRHSRPAPLAIFTADVVRAIDTNETQERLAQDLLRLPIEKLVTSPISSTATQLDALRMMNRKEQDSLYVVSPHTGEALGIVTRRSIERSYRNPAL